MVESALLSSRWWRSNEWVAGVAAVSIFHARRAEEKPNAQKLPSPCASLRVAQYGVVRASAEARPCADSAAMVAWRALDLQRGHSSVAHWGHDLPQLFLAPPAALLQLLPCEARNLLSRVVLPGNLDVAVFQVREVAHVGSG